jgi:F-box and WD-40 domain protein 1/11
MNDWAPAQEAMYEEASSLGSTGVFHVRQEGIATGVEPRSRGINLSLPWRQRPKSLAFGDEELAAKFQDLSIERTVTHITNQTYGHAYSQSQSTFSAEPNRPESGSLRGMIRRASVSIKGMVSRRTSVTSHTILEEEKSPTSRPGTSHSAWQRIRQATCLRHSRSLYASDLSLETRSMLDPNAPIPGIGGPPVIPRNTGAAAKAAAALQNEYLGLTTKPSLHQQTLHNKWLAPSGSDDGNDRESGIGITVTSSECELDTTEEEVAPLPQDNSISRLDFIADLPIEIAIQILAHLDAAGLATASLVSRHWYRTTNNQHIWRESFLREKTGTYATSGRTTSGAGLGVPTVRPNNDWKQIYRVKGELDKRWKEGKARPVYLNGHLDSIYCLQFDEYVTPSPE